MTKETTFFIEPDSTHEVTTEVKELETPSRFYLNNVVCEVVKVESRIIRCRESTKLDTRQGVATDYSCFLDEGVFNCRPIISDAEEFLRATDIQSPVEPSLSFI